MGWKVIEVVYYQREDSRAGRDSQDSAFRRRDKSIKDGNELLKQMDKMLSMELDNVEPTINVLEKLRRLSEKMW